MEDALWVLYELKGIIMSHVSNLIESDIQSYLKQHENKDLLRFLTCGNVDDGKSTLIGRLLHDSKMIFEDHMAAIKNDSKRFNTTNGEFDLALLVDGLQSEREQGITIDVAYRYFSTDKRKFIIADCPGHEQYTRNMATGASNCDLAIVMIDARYGVQTQTKRHSYIASLLGIKHVIVAVNKMDIVGYDQEVFRKIKADYKAFAKELNIPDIRFVPISALCGDNVVDRSVAMDWYPGATLMTLLETVKLQDEKNLEAFRLPVQYVNRPNLDFRGFCGTIASGVIRVGDKISVMPSGKTSTIESIYVANQTSDIAFVGQAVTVTLNDEIDISRGDVIAKTGKLPNSTDSFNSNVVWMGESPLQVGKEYLIKSASKTAVGRVQNIIYRTDMNSFNEMSASALTLNEIGFCSVIINDALSIDTYLDSAGTGSFVIIDKLTNGTVGAGMITDVVQESALEHSTTSYSDREIALNKFIRDNYPEWNCIKFC
ncbi:hypothetical protein GCM10023333_04900 [Ferrimonas pelagia]|uniref:Sulfate adenylyltransferase subunit 1 n=2 Tax=Ferrimonas pelagia TaxID=1177826 RepID=A0ABP9EKS8_9GAMM